MTLGLVEEMLLAQLITVSYQMIQRWGRKFGPHNARRLCSSRPLLNDVWHTDEIVISITCKKTLALERC